MACLRVKDESCVHPKAMKDEMVSTSHVHAFLLLTDKPEFFTYAQSIEKNFLTAIAICTLKNFCFDFNNGCGNEKTNKTIDA